MSRIVSKLVGAVITFGSIGIMSGACVEAEGRIFIEKFVAPGDAGCGSEDETAFNSRTFVECFDGACVGSARCAHVANHMVPSLDNESNNNGVETSIVILHSYDLRYISDDVDLGTADATVQITAPVEPDAFSSISLSYLTAEASAALGSAIESGATSSLIIGVRFYGRTTGGLEVETPETFMGVTVTGL